MSYPLCYHSNMKRSKPVKARVNPQGMMGSAVRIEKPKKGKGSYRRNPKHKYNYGSNTNLNTFGYHPHV